jgi:hypothetical protein
MNNSVRCNLVWKDVANGREEMRTLKVLLCLGILFFPNIANADQLNLECNIEYKDYIDGYSIIVDLNSGNVVSTYHAIANKDNSVNIDYKITSNALIDNDNIIYKAESHSIDYMFTINRKTLNIIRFISGQEDVEAGHGSCKIIEVNGVKP